MPRRQQKSSKRRRSRRPKLEFSKWLSIVDTSWFLVLTVLLIVLIFFRSDLAQFYVTIWSTLATVFLSLRLGYTAKAGVENYKKIEQSNMDLEMESEG